MNTITLTSDSNNLIVSKSIVAESIEVAQLNVTDDIYLNHNIYTPVASILTYAGTTSPNGWLLCDGSEVSKTAYPRLFSVIGTLYGTPTNSSNFVLPNLADRVPVGKSNSTSVGNSGGNSSLTLSVSQLPSHTHTGTTSSNGSHSHTGTTDSSGSHNHAITDPGHRHSVEDAYFAENQGRHQNVFGTSAGTDNDNDYITRNINTGYSYTGISVNDSGSHTHTFTTGTASAHTHTFTTDSTGSGSSIDIRNKYVVINYIIRY
jgi:microcystin-dependent protein